MESSSKNTCFRKGNWYKMMLFISVVTVGINVESKSRIIWKYIAIENWLLLKYHINLLALNVSLHNYRVLWKFAAVEGIRSNSIPCEWVELVVIMKNNNPFMEFCKQFLDIFLFREVFWELKNCLVIYQLAPHGAHKT